MYTHLTRALLGNTDLSVAEASRLHNAILRDNLVWNRALDSLIEERIPAVITAMHPLERSALEKRINLVRMPSCWGGMRSTFAIVFSSPTSGFLIAARCGSSRGRP